MSKRSAQPALYEKINLRAGPLKAASPSGVEPKPVVEVGGSSQWLTPGRSVRLPVGYVLLAAGAVLGLIFLTYIFGHSRGYNAAEAELNNLLVQAANAQAKATLLEPLKEVPTGSPAVPNAAKQGSPPAVSPSRHPSTWGKVLSDPRQKGLNYFILTEGTESGALTLVDFCRNAGLETYVVAGKNGRPTRVIALPGFQTSARASADVKALESRIHSIGEKWKAVQRGNTDLRDAFPSLYGG
jgi:hypothetical protein